MPEQPLHYRWIDRGRLGPAVRELERKLHSERARNSFNLSRGRSTLSGTLLDPAE